MILYTNKGAYTRAEKPHGSVIRAYKWDAHKSPRLSQLETIPLIHTEPDYCVMALT